MLEYEVLPSVRDERLFRVTNTLEIARGIVRDLQPSFVERNHRRRRQEEISSAFASSALNYSLREFLEGPFTPSLSNNANVRNPRKGGLELPERGAMQLINTTRAILGTAYRLRTLYISGFSGEMR